MGGRSFNHALCIKRALALLVRGIISSSHSFFPQHHPTPFTMKFSLTTVLLFSAAGSLAAPVSDVNTNVEELFTRQAAQSIDAAMKKKGRKYFGTCSDPGRFNSGQNGAIIKANFGQITPENRYVCSCCLMQPSRYTMGNRADYVKHEVGRHRAYSRKVQLRHR
jgi:hypothetical protein